MASIFYAWEFGANLGHLGVFLPMARKLREDGHQVHWAVARPTLAGRLLAPEGFRWLPAPAAVENPRPAAPMSYSDILLRFGYERADDLHGLVVAWTELMRLTGAELVLADHAPTSLLAARCLGLPAMLFSNGFTAPPRRNPLPNMRPWQRVPEQQLRALDAQALASINAVLAHYGKPPLKAVADLFEVAEESLLTFPELDHYPGRGPARYWGCLSDAGRGQPVAWPDVPGKRLFAYLRPECVHAGAVLQALHALGKPTAVFFPGMPAEWRQRAAAPHLVFLDAPADLVQMAQEADAAITYASLATTTAFLLGGKPLLLLPSHLEQFLVAKRVGEMGAGQVVDPERPPGDLAAAVTSLLDDPFWRGNARAFARKYEAFDQAKVLDNIARRIGELVAGGTEKAP